MTAPTNRFGVLRTSLVTVWFIHLYLAAQATVEGWDAAVLPLFMLAVITGALGTTIHPDPALNHEEDADAH
ncbi:hypothetical protein AB0K18_43020 [Nonomuraea sp. NPDC049421]|uniref:hypothetical protein n=1 Tax=Nonomuraea sp. NPDC049421 TaxID=3155275 RepID=UPI003440D319